MTTFGRKPHCGAIATTCSRRRIVCARGMPGQSQNDGAIRAILILIVIPQELCHGVVDLLVVGGGRLEDADGLATTALFQKSGRGG